MKIKKKNILILLFIITTLLITGCIKREKIIFDGEEGSLTFNIKNLKNYKLSNDKKDLRSSREQGILIGNEFKIGIEFDDTFNYFFKSDFEKLKKERKDYKDYKEIEYSGLKGIQYFYEGYMRYEVVLQLEQDKEHTLVLTIYGNEDNEKSAKETINNKKVQDILNNMTDIKGK